MSEPRSADALLARIATATSLREGSEGVAAVLRAVNRSGPLPLAVLARQVRLPLPVATAVRRELEAADLLVRTGGGIALSEAGRAFCRDALGLSAPAASGARVATEAGEPLSPLLAEALRELEAHIVAGPAVDVTLDQAPCTAETAMRRAVAMHEAGAIEGRRILIVGDDDSMSIAVLMIARALGVAPRRVSVLELDENRCGHLSEAARRLGLPVEVVRHDLRDRLPAEMVGAFDVVETDPPYTLDGMALFVRRGLEGLGPAVGRPVFLSYADLAPVDQLALVRRLADLCLAPMRVVPSFNRYAGASILGSAGQFMELRTAGPVACGEPARFGGPIYTGEVRPRLRRYRCTRCGAATIVGAGEPFATIEALKATGCPSCGNGTFRREGRVPLR